jgi:hypothetical protein
LPKLARGLRGVRLVETANTSSLSFDPLLDEDRVERYREASAPPGHPLYKDGALHPVGKS